MPIAGFTASADLSDWMFRAVKISGSYTVDKADAAGDVPFGILQNAPKSGQPATIAVPGDVAKAKAGGALTPAGGKLAVDLATAGKLGMIIEHAGNATIIGTLIRTAADGDIFLMLIERA